MLCVPLKSPLSPSSPQILFNECKCYGCDECGQKQIDKIKPKNEYS